ncbi:hypothetical protein FSPOR_6180 [Fusarium sporotrichioides]|uniref:WSC domain-containing protein n=1 Tax=Fusarium sporotrichioides TaxID=5514 RepID=A0A395S434_FUSSP|nr:hypothetical protein FSPOR_6180 [Fusarium sporotrichioides]
MAVTKFGLLTLLSASAVQVSGDSGLQRPARDAVLNQATPQGCFSTLPSKTSLVQEGTFMTTGQCLSQCQNKNKSVAILYASKCYCSESYPAKNSLVDDEQCNYNCPGYAPEACGGLNPRVYSVYNTGLDLDPAYDTGEGKDDNLSITGSGTTTQDVRTTWVSTSTTTYTTPETEAEETSMSTAHAEQTSQVAPVVNETLAAATPSASASTVPENASPRLSNPIGNFIRMMAHLL